MATLTMTPAVRKPFGTVDASRIRSMLKTNQSLKNQQNASPLKQTPAPDSDSENVDPMTLKASPKRKRSSEDDGVLDESFKPVKASRINLTVKSKVDCKTTQPLSTRVNRPSTPVSTPISKPAGRSPQAKSRKAFGRRSSTDTTTRIEAPVGRLSALRANAAPFSIATALSSGKSKNKRRSNPASWNFEIHVDSEQDEMTNLMQHSTCVLDISDDEGKTKKDGRGKENIPPHELGIEIPNSAQQTSDTAASRKNLMTDEPRTPLGELKVSDYYAPGCDALSRVVIYELEPEKNEKEDDEKKTSNISTAETAPAKPEKLSASTISSLLQATAPKDISELADKTTGPSETEIEIWESGSAAEEAANAAAEGVEKPNIFAPL
ncbi:hypothetical protein VTN00DRAFT_6512 [Thermoascus crustaceus]|uniref:uncharacterized protein n=1 Tax=Thermoascus crustaceus TaxID=5088 RepID=UPI00374316E3